MSQDVWVLVFELSRSTRGVFIFVVVVVVVFILSRVGIVDTLVVVGSGNETGIRVLITASALERSEVWRTRAKPGSRASSSRASRVSGGRAGRSSSRRSQGSRTAACCKLSIKSSCQVGVSDPVGRKARVAGVRVFRVTARHRSVIYHKTTV
jgi:hypothetical protein